MTTPLSLVREAVVRAVPEIRKEIVGIPCPEGRVGCLVLHYRNEDRPITLADVLCTLKNKYNHSAANLGGFTRDLLNSGWNLTQSLENQSQETILFLHDILSQ